MIELIIFDLEGTTVDDQSVAYQTMTSFLQDKGYEVSFEQVLELSTGIGKRESLKRLVKQSAPRVKDAELEHLFEQFTERLKRAYTSLDAVPSPNADRVLPFLRSKDLKIVLNTDHNRFTAQHLLHRVKWQKGVYFDLLVTPEDTGKYRPDPQMIQYAQRQLDVPEASKVAKVGSAPIDIMEGKNADCGLTIGITTGAHTLLQLQSAQPDHIIDNLDELIPLLGL